MGGDKIVFSIRRSENTNHFIYMAEPPPDPSGIWLPDPLPDPFEYQRSYPYECCARGCHSQKEVSSIYVSWSCSLVPVCRRCAIRLKLPVNKPPPHESPAPLSSRSHFTQQASL